MLETTKWRLLVVKHAVDRYAPGEELRRHATRAFYVGTAYAGVKAEVRVRSWLLEERHNLRPA